MWQTAWTKKLMWPVIWQVWSNQNQPHQLKIQVTSTLEKLTNLVVSPLLIQSNPKPSILFHPLFIFGVRLMNSCNWPWCLLFFGVFSYLFLPFSACAKFMYILVQEFIFSNLHTHFWNTLSNYLFYTTFH